MGKYDNSDVIKDAIIFIDEFDATSNYLLNGGKNSISI